MSHFQIDVDSGKTVRLPTGGKYCPEDIVVTANGGDGESAYEKGIAHGKEQGKKDEYDRFWDSFQQNGQRTDYNYAFYGVGWTNETYNNKYIPKPKTARNMYSYSEFTGRIDVDMSICTDATGMFSRVSCSEIGVLDLRSLGFSTYFIEVCPNLTKIEKIIVTKTAVLNDFCFNNIPLLTRVIIEGEIGSKWNMRNAVSLDNESVQSVIDCLIDLTGQESQTLTFHNNVGKKLTEEQKATIAAKNWTLVY